MVLLEDVDTGSNGDLVNILIPFDDIEVRREEILFTVRHLLEDEVDVLGLAVQLVLQKASNDIGDFLRFLERFLPDEHFLLEVERDSWEHC